MTSRFLDQVAAGTISVQEVDDAVKTILRTKFTLGLFESWFASI